MLLLTHTHTYTHAHETLKFSGHSVPWLITTRHENKKKRKRDAKGNRCCFCCCLLMLHGRCGGSRDMAIEERLIKTTDRILDTFFLCQRGIWSCCWDTTTSAACGACTIAFSNHWKLIVFVITSSSNRGCTGRRAWWGRCRGGGSGWESKTRGCVINNCDDRIMEVNDGIGERYWASRDSRGQIEGRQRNVSSEIQRKAIKMAPRRETIMETVERKKKKGETHSRMCVKRALRSSSSKLYYRIHRTKHAGKTHTRRRPNNCKWITTGTEIALKVDKVKGKRSWDEKTEREVITNKHVEISSDVHKKW